MKIVQQLVLTILVVNLLLLVFSRYLQVVFQQLTMGQVTTILHYSLGNGISKVGSYTGNGADNRTIDCGFTSGARFVIIKRTDQQKWFVFDGQRGIVSGNDPYFALDNSDAQVTSADYVEPANAGFAVNSHSDFNATGGNYKFMQLHNINN